MGNNTPECSNITSTSLDDWVKLEDQGNCELWSNKKMGKLFQAYPISEHIAADPKELEVYEFRKSNSRYLVSVEAVIGQQTGLVCTQSQGAYVLTENIDSRLSHHNHQLSFEEGLYVLSQAASGYNTLNSFFGSVEASTDMICINDQGNVKVWLNEHLAVNSQPGLPPRTALDHSQARLRNKDSVGHLFRIVQNTIRGNYPQSFRKQVGEISTYFEASNFVDYYKDIHRIVVPNKLNPLRKTGSCLNELRSYPAAYESHTSLPGEHSIEPTKLNSASSVHPNLRTQVMESESRLATRMEGTSSSIPYSVPSSTHLPPRPPLNPQKSYQNVFVNLRKNSDTSNQSNQRGNFVPVDGRNLSNHSAWMYGNKKTQRIDYTSMQFNVEPGESTNKGIPSQHNFYKQQSTFSNQVPPYKNLRPAGQLNSHNSAKSQHFYEIPAQYGPSLMGQSQPVQSPILPHSKQSSMSNDLHVGQSQGNQVQPISNDPHLESKQERFTHVRDPNYIPPQMDPGLRKQAPPPQLKSNTNYTSSQNDHNLKRPQSPHIEEKPDQDPQSGSRLERESSKQNGIVADEACYNKSEQKSGQVKPISSQQVTSPSWNKQIQISEEQPSSPKASPREVKVSAKIASTREQQSNRPAGLGDKDIQEYIRQKYQSYLKEQSTNQEGHPQNTTTVTRKRSSELHGNIEERYEKYVSHPQKMGGVKERAMGIETNYHPSQPSTLFQQHENSENGQVSYDQLRSMLLR